MAYQWRRSSNTLPSFSNSSTVREKYAERARLHSRDWWIPVRVQISPKWRLRFYIFNIQRLSTTFIPEKRACIIFTLAAFSFSFVLFALSKRFLSQSKQWPSSPFSGEPSTLVFQREDLQRVWEWEVQSGHFPSRERIPREVQLKKPLTNPSLPPLPLNYAESTRGVGPKRMYLDLTPQPPDGAYPRRPLPGSAADLNIVMEHCDFSKKKAGCSSYVRDCLEVLRIGAGLDNGRRVRTNDSLDDWKYIYVERPLDVPPKFDTEMHGSGAKRVEDRDKSTMIKKKDVPWEVPPISLPPIHRSAFDASSCDDYYPRIFHMFWAGTFTDKPYATLLSFLFTQNLGLSRDSDPKVCRPQFWVWINPGPAASIPNPNAVHEMNRELRSNPWAAPFLHPRFQDIIKFKLWNTTEQLDGVPELKDEWRGRNLFNSGGRVVNVTKKVQNGSPSEGEAQKTKKRSTKEDNHILNRAGSKSSSTYDRLSVILSDMARFILCHRYGGIYLDADTIFLRDWEDLWGWKGAFAYRWSRLARYNTAVLKLNKNSALGKVLFKTALKNNLDFHPMTVSRYTKDAYLEPLLLRLPDALFDSAWLNTEDYQLDRPPQPLFTSFEHFFDTPSRDGAAPQAMGFDGFFKGAYSYHFHNFWWRPFDPARNWPDLGLRFADNEQRARIANKENTANSRKTPKLWSEEDSEDVDQRDLAWATVLKRTFESYVRGERTNMYGEWIDWEGA
ncbi:hypothetical protein FA15DRAFT_690132 [Coprinopsis marcescibilis]|uniref:SnoRNA binding protein n=1 Tax=Coprinopsis marcescibilis TaxID=230819 RepID=A0A5C3LNS7_COPMA|nr:hypothetical protein FA15DRAFT_690132 [Coprinopsis marcescibilis]